MILKNDERLNFLNFIFIRPFNYIIPLKLIFCFLKWEIDNKGKKKGVTKFLKTVWFCFATQALSP